MTRGDRPAKGSPERREWVLDSVRATFAESACTRRAFTMPVWQRLRGVAPDGAVRAAPCNDDVAMFGGWGALVEAALGPVPVPLAAVPVGHRVKGVSTLVGPDGEIKSQWVKTRADEIDREEVLARLMETLPERVRARDGCVPEQTAEMQDSLLAAYVFGDPHFGLRSWREDAGEDFDLEIAERITVAAIRDLVLRGPRAATALVVSLGDTLHADNVQGHTTKGDHALDVDGRYAKVLQAAMRILCTVVDAALEHHGKVIVDIQAGNHDTYGSMMLAVGLDAYFRNEPRCNVVIDPAMRHYHRFGRVLIGTVHGDKTKPEDLGEIMAAEKPEDWGATDCRAWFQGHVHHSSVKELRGCTVETFRTLAARDSWAASRGYKAGRDLRRIVYHERFGEVSREIASVGYLESRMAGAA